MWSSGVTFVWCFLFLSTVYALPTTKSENDSEVQKPQPIFLEAIELPSEEKPTDNSKPSEMAVDPKPTDMKPTEQSKPSEPSAPTGTFLEPVSLNVGPPRRQFLYDQRQDGKYNIRADLENFVILVVPSSGNSLLDLLKRSSQRQQQHNKRTQTQTKHHKKYHSASTPGKTVEVKKAASRLDYLNRPDGEAETPVGEFIEGRTPYHVDIRSDEIQQPAQYGSVPNSVRSLHGAASIADIPLSNLEDNTASTSSGASDATIVLSTVTGDSTTRADADLANAQWELTLLGAQEQCGPDRRRDSYGICQFVPADYATT